MIFFNEFIQSIFIGFGVFVFATSFIRLKNEKGNLLIASLTDSATLIISLAALGYLFICLAGLYARFQSDEEYYYMMSRITGPYGFGYWIYPICYGIFPQLLWVKKVRKVKAMRIITALLLFFALYIEKIIILVTSLHRDYIPSNWTMLPGYFIIYDWFVSLVVFSLVLGLTHFTKLRFAGSK